MWERLSNDGGIHDGDTDPSWDEGFDKIDTLNSAVFAGHSDWRMPSLLELLSIVDFGVEDPAVPAVFNTGCVPGCTTARCSCTDSNGHWTSTTYVNDPEGAWLVDFGQGEIGADGKQYYGVVRAVRGGG